MADTTKANVLLIAPNLSTVSDTIFTLVLADAAVEITSTTHTSAYVEVIQRYYVAHILTAMIAKAAFSGSGVVEREKVGDLELEYSRINDSARSHFETTAQGREYLRLNGLHRLMRVW